MTESVCMRYMYIERYSEEIEIERERGRYIEWWWCFKRGRVRKIAKHTGYDTFL